MVQFLLHSVVIVHCSPLTAAEQREEEVQVAETQEVKLKQEEKVKSGKGGANVRECWMSSQSITGELVNLSHQEGHIGTPLSAGFLPTCIL